MLRLAAILLLTLTSSIELAAENTLRIAVAANFHPTLNALANEYSASHPNTKITLVPGSSGALFAQISNGAPYHAFFSADAERPALLEKNGNSLSGSRFTFALGILAFWQPGSIDPQPANAQTIALAKPQLAPFGRASEEALATFSLPSTTRLVYASNSAQAFTYAQTGAADAAFVAYSQLLLAKVDPSQYRLIDPSHYAPIKQQAVALSNDPSTLDFLHFCQSEPAKKLITTAGYRLPD